MTATQPIFLAQGTYPNIRMRRNRKADWKRRLVAETKLSEDDLILPLFVREASSEKEISSMPGVCRHTVDELIEIVGHAHDARIPAICLFPYYPREDRLDNVLHMLTPENVFCQAIRRIRTAFPNIGIIADLALDCYATHGQDGMIRDGVILNDETNHVLGEYAITLAQAGADVIAPSDMMDGRIGYIRQKLDEAGFENTSIMSYAAKYASNFYGPFRDAVGSKTCLAQADKKTYQMDFSNMNEAIREASLDLQEGADMLIVKPAIPYLDVAHVIKETFGVPTFVYHVSGEYAMLKAAAANGWLNYDLCLYETMIACKRAGADGILTYAALEAAEIIKKGF